MLKRIAVALIAVSGFLAGFGVKSVIPNSPSRPTPEQYLQSLVHTHLTWIEQEGVKIAYDHARGLEFIVGKKRIELVVDVVEGLKNRHPSYTLNDAVGFATAFIARYAGFNAASQAIYVFKQLLDNVAQYGPYLWAIIHSYVETAPVGTFLGRSVSVSVTPKGNPNGGLGTAIFSVGAVAR